MAMTPDEPVEKLNTIQFFHRPITPETKPARFFESEPVYIWSYNLHTNRPAKSENHEHEHNKPRKVGVHDSFG